MSIERKQRATSHCMKPGTGRIATVMPLGSVVAGTQRSPSWLTASFQLRFSFVSGERELNGHGHGTNAAPAFAELAGRLARTSIVIDR